MNGERKANRGFALLITVTLLAFIVVLLVGLAAYTRVETAVAGNMQRQAQARENALLALNVAVAQLQKHAGRDQRVTATAENFGAVDGTRHYTGVWSIDGGAEPLTWLVSGNEFTVPDPNPDAAEGSTVPAPLAITPAAPGARVQTLVGPKTTGAATRDAPWVEAPLVDIKATGVPGAAIGTETTIGRYAWWVGDQGVKAPVAVSDTSNSIDYPPFVLKDADGNVVSTDLRDRIQQQIALGAGASDANGQPVFETRDANNSLMVSNDKIMTFNQLAFLHATNGNNAIGFGAIQQYFHAWAPNNFAVLANTKGGGLRRDLSLRPDLLGTAFVAWAKYDPTRGGYMEDPAAPLAPEPLQPYAANPVRRRYKMTPPVEDLGIRHSVAPVLSFFGLSFSIRNNSKGVNPTELELSARCVVGLWNPYSAALVPEDLQIMITGLPVAIVEDALGRVRTVPIQSIMGTELKFFLPFTPDGTNPDRSSWLPGRVYNWSAESNGTDPGDPGNPMAFYKRDAARRGDGVVRVAGSPLHPDSVAGIPTYRRCSVADPQTLTIELRRVSDGTALAKFKSPTFEAFQTDFVTRSTGDHASDFAYVFRLPDQAEIPLNETAAWLSAAGRDPREFEFPTASQEGYVVVAGQPPRPELLVTPGQAGFPASYSQLLLDRYTDTDGMRYDEDAPVFELPRAPLLSLGSLQHLQIIGERPFAVGNPWGGARNAWFDEHFFSALPPDVTWSNISAPLPNHTLQVLRRHVDGSMIEAVDLNGAIRTADGFSAKHVLQGSAFNINSVNAAAWRAVLRSARAAATQPISELAVTSSGTTSLTAGDEVETITDPFLTGSRIAIFPRFPQSAQETLRANDDVLQSDPSGPNNIVNTPLFRRGLRMLSAAEVAMLAEKIFSLVQQKHADSGPFRSIEEFLAPSSLFIDAGGNPTGLLAKAIEDTALNTDTALRLTATTAEFSSQWLTQADIMTALAPVLFARSDTFLVRTYGEAVNPTTNATEGRAWCEAIVQRVPEYVDAVEDDPAVLPADLASELNRELGRRFKVISFRWLTRSDI